MFNSESVQICYRTDSPSFTEEPNLKNRTQALNNQFKDRFGLQPALLVRSPGRAEVIGNHTDYNLGYALSCAISRSTLLAIAARSDQIIRIVSNSFPNEEINIPINDIKPSADRHWSNYVRGVIAELKDSERKFSGADILVNSDVPSSGGVSSSASFEMAIAMGLSTLNKLRFSPLELALLCKRAENGPFVNTPCGLLDQASVALAKSGQMVLIDFKPSDNTPATVKLIPADLRRQDLSFVISVDPEVKRVLGESGYPARRRMCEASCPILSTLLGRKIQSLRDVNAPDFERVKSELEAQGSQYMRMRVEHIVYENQRVLDSVMALQTGDFQTFGKLLSSSGRSALELYGLDEKTPELTSLVKATREWPKALGSRNMGGGFSAITLTLLHAADVPAFQAAVNSAYEKEWKRPLQFIDFNLTQGAEVL